MAFILGAGRHSESKRQEYSKLCKSACRKGASLIANGKTALEAATETVVTLEDSALTNAGYGSNLTWDGTVECDASAMDGSSRLWGAVGAVGGLKNPCRVAKEICLGQKKEGVLGRVPPCILVGSGAVDWAKNSGLKTMDAVNLIDPKALEKHRKYKKLLSKHKKLEDMECDLRSDTVGAVCVDSNGHVAAVCSSGGILLKHSGRLGQAAMYGAGCWAEETEKRSVATCTTGCGEHLIRCTLARSVASKLTENTSQPLASFVSSTMKQDFLDSPFLNDIKEKMGGVLALTWSAEELAGELLWGHTTQTMALGYMQTNTKPVFKMSSLPPGKIPGQSLVVGGTAF